jgi:catechol-2,3-dioxygenase
MSFQNFYKNKLGFQVTDRVTKNNGELATCFTTSNHEHHTIACFKSSKKGMDHHSYEAGDWNFIKNWCDHFASNNIKLMWGPGRHGPGNNLFVFIEDIDGNWIEISAELETVHGRPVKNWPQEERTLNLWGNAIMRS